MQKDKSPVYNDLRIPSTACSSLRRAQLIEKGNGGISRFAVELNFAPSIDIEQNINISFRQPITLFEAFTRFPWEFRKTSANALYTALKKSFEQVASESARVILHR